MNTAALLHHFHTHRAPLALSKAGVVTWDDAELHREAYRADPEGYVLLALVPGVGEQQRARVLLQVLASSRVGVDVTTRVNLDKGTRALLFGLTPNVVVTVLLALRRMRVNHKHTTRAILGFVLDHPDAELLIAARRPSLVDCFEHALGKATARGCVRRIAEGDVDSPELRRMLLRFSVNPAAAVERVRQLYAPGTYGVPVLTEPVAPLEPVREREPIVTVSNRGDIAATLVRIYRGGSASELSSALVGYVADATRDLPRLAGTVAVVLDASESMRGYGEREWALLSQAEALRLVLARVCTGLAVVEVGAAQQGPTDLATGLLDALDAAPDLVVLVTDGYENRMPGDLARMVETLPHIGIKTPIVLCQIKFTGRDVMTLRDPVPALPQHGVWHQDDFAALLPWMFAHCPTGGEWIREVALRFLDTHSLQGASA
ncbi:vWA domain-containing protein [Nocardia sp. NPDC051030]|uniref:vWA domain-containing protein n=1 Tax=Nocardia sp. NPDC051030 TaxID=3155162 RepID=UPI0034231A57